MRPFVSVVTPTYNRRKFLNPMIQCYVSQLYPKDRMEWIILDDGEDCVKDIFDAAATSIPNLRYIRMEPKLLIGAKRNILNKEAKGDIIIAMDDDDFYPPERVSHVVTKFASNPTINLAGSTVLYMFYTDIKKIYKLGPYNQKHATNGTMAWRRSYALTHTYDETVTHAEERSFLNNYIYPMIQLDPMKVMLVISHSENTYDKKKLRDGNNRFVKETSLKIQGFIKSQHLKEFYSNA
jgi:glycosyltransferase involved in cell wall biosynthesis